MDYRIERHNGVAPYQQIIQQTRQALRLGQLVPGDMLPSASAVVAATAVNPNTVLKAYRELEREGLVDTRQGRGTFVRASLAQPGTQAGSPLRDELRVWMATARAGGLEREDVAALLAAELDVFFPRPVGSR
ncbi:GntR family transcriptional regulator [Streptomyces pseudovenezuelae]|uniref:GntR family transcriptional regulator n=1 Tax=Streptomyces pseudovenezuelae TaxID=67350 RepID=A0ABT6M2U7_9ACTN|nr:GntR family transcriptional regulator [Streptomyces pseudovenezuelae]MDH6222852.1 GntR family transcriptional regulator [Streptomyces pseudovenezuelae]